MSFLSGLWGAFRDFFTGGFGGGSGSSGPINRLYVGNLSYRVKEEELRGLFAKYGRVKTLHLIRDKITRRLKGYAFIEMSPEDAVKALALNGVDFLGRKLVVSSAKSKQRPAEQKSSSEPRPSSETRSSSELRSSGESRPPRRRSSQPKWRNKRRSGPRVYGQAEGDNNTPVERLE